MAARLLPVLLLAACAGGAGRPSRAAWAADARTLVGHGEGATPAEAHAAALADLAAQVRARVSARTHRLARAEASSNRVWGSVQASQEIDVDARLEHAELARRRRLAVNELGRSSVVLVLDRAAWAARHRAQVEEESRLVARPIGGAPVVRWHALGRAVRAARACRNAEQEAATMDPASGDATPAIDDALAAILAARDAQARGLECVVRIEGDAALQEVAAAACGASPTPSVLGAPASDAHRLLVRGRVERTRVDDEGLVFVQSRAVLVLEGDGRTLETLVLGGALTRRGHLDAARASAAADAALLALVQAELEARFR